VSEREGPGLRTLLGRIIGLKLRPEQISREDPSVTQAVDPLFERLIREARRGQRDGPVELQPNWTAGERAVFTTRYLVEEFDSTGPLGLLATGLLDEALAGFRLLGLDEHADLVAKLLASGFDADSTDDGADVLDFAEDWYNLEDADPARAAYIQAHPEEFRT
jgi:hypothetical protein